MTTPKPLVFYDLAGKEAEMPWSPNTFKTRYCLSYKCIAFVTIWVEYPDIQMVVRAKGGKSTLNINGRNIWTLPALLDPNTSLFISGSLQIAEYLEFRYPDLPALFPNDSIALQVVFAKTFDDMIEPRLSALNAVLGAEWLTSDSKWFFMKSRAERFGKPWKEICSLGSEERDAAWKAFEETLGLVDEWYQRSGGRFILGDVPSYADFAVAARLKWFQTVRRKSTDPGDPVDWNTVCSWHGGRWERLVKDLDRCLRY
ncbi:hypothetical protein CONPUDRAFT_98863 [Coniophora puteana RWD-64-598 SS2]|uniref:Uncharacterized protein n=1 Tax=Coniophora puteana (strain RWD-64-598) TaxID=741705 RepID=A0A5M3N453_CONPW|nr:uncharacterized protein CONPUDRAFT_98863 [Coniophora puteana RWD-64-598 SS2]EIW85691.1 hypothetical protein CONPUDRAFT_98863 [Coniophora puteana RWD-64-598 SS2]